MTLAIRRKRRFERLFDGLTADDVRQAAADPDRVAAAYETLHQCGGPAKRRTFTLCSEPIDGGKKPADTLANGGVLELILYLAPHRLAGLSNVCIWSTHGCRNACLFTSGRGGMAPIQAARAARNRFAHADPLGFLAILYREHAAADRKAQRLGLEVLARLNGTSDVRWEDIPAARCLFDDFERLHHRDYTKATRDQRPDPVGMRYSLARSVWTDRETVADIVRLVGMGLSVSVLVDDFAPLAHLPGVVDASKGDHWLALPGGTVGALSPKGDATESDLFDAAELAAALTN